jgi:hypothetical protein
MPAKKKTARRKPPNAGKGRPKGAKNKVTLALKDGILEAYNKAGGVEYLLGVAKDDPKTFCGLLARVLPHEIEADMKGAGDTSFSFRMVYTPPTDEDGESAGS